MKYYILCIVIFALILVAACSSMSKSKGDIYVSKGVCLGKCPVYNLHLDDKGNISFEGIKFTPVIGKKSVKLSKEDNNTLREIFAKINIEEINSAYDVAVRDAPETTIQYKNYETKFKLYRSVPSEVKKFIDILENKLKEHKLLY